MEIFYLWVSYLLLGVFAGTLAGPLGVGGGLIIVPILAVLGLRMPGKSLLR